MSARKAGGAWFDSMRRESIILLFRSVVISSRCYFGDKNKRNYSERVNNNRNNSKIVIHYNYSNIPTIYDNLCIYLCCIDDGNHELVRGSHYRRKEKWLKIINCCFLINTINLSNKEYPKITKQVVKIRIV